jgi:hypothetical protein
VEFERLRMERQLAESEGEAGVKGETGVSSVSVHFSEAKTELTPTAAMLERLEEILRVDRIERRCKKPSHFQLLENTKLLKWQVHTFAYRTF